MKSRLDSLLKQPPQRRLPFGFAASALLALCISSPVPAQALHNAPCVTSVVLRNCPDQQPTPFQTEAERDEAANRQQMQDQFATTEQLQQRRAAQAENDLDRVTIYGHQLAPAKPALSEFGQTVTKSGRKDCRNAYSTSGPHGSLGIFDLVFDSVTGKPCSWQ